MAYDTIVIENNPVNVLESFHEELNQDEFNIQSVITRDMGGFWSAKFRILQPRRNYALQMLANGPGRSVRFFNEKSISVWEGFISKVTVDTGAASAFNDVQPVANEVWVRYRDIVGGALTRSTVASHTNSQNKYGQKDWVLSGGQLAGAVADQKADNYLNLNFWATPQLDSFEIGGRGGGEISLQIQCLGWWHTLDWRVYNQTVDVGSVNTSTLMDEIIGTFSKVPSSIKNNLEAWWTMDEASAGAAPVTRLDSSPNGNDLTDNGTIASRAGRVNNAGDYVPGDNTYLQIADRPSLSFADEDFAFCCWVYADAWGVNRRLIDKYDFTAGDREYLLYYELAANRFRFFVSPNGVAATGVSANTLGAPAAATWYLIFCWHDSVANTINIQVNNGGVDSAAHATGCNDNISPFTVGARVSGGLGEVMDGMIDEVAVWRRIPTASERTVIYNSGLGIGFGDIGKTTRTGGIGEFVAETVIQANATQVTREYDADRRAGGIIKAAAELGDNTGLTWNAYMGLDRIFYFTPSAPPFEETL